MCVIPESYKHFNCLNLLRVVMIIVKKDNKEKFAYRTLPRTLNNATDRCLHICS